MLWTSEGTLGVGHPIHVSKLVVQPVEAAGISQMFERTSQSQLLVAISRTEQTKELVPEPFAEDPDREEEFGVAAADPARVVEGEASGGNHAM